ncbi:hypothetical protein RA28_09625 [Ruegeria sp. ANG-S4]|uniref:helix-turn-helix domain-containing protein n=1 Tax=Ruegeria sp. ANG-S4 TaxID=1577904 RepID=UPI00057F25ED|nr:helix-turn-helix domain-containing protein [Ruegeria sp. ANG-S4]KIC45910.1 hypothetical protein RA28_09625 [Ruegeria sp. ANG-S4]
MSRQDFNTDALKRQNRFAFWREAICSTYVELDCESPLRGEKGFHSHLTVEHLGASTLSRIGGSRQSVARRRQDIRKASRNWYLLSLQTRNVSRFSIGDHEELLHTGDLMLYSSSSTYRIDVPNEFEQIVLKIPAEDFEPRVLLHDPQKLHKISGNSPFARLLSDNIKSITANTADQDDRIGSALSDVLLDLIWINLKTTHDHPLEGGTHAQILVQRMRQFIQDNIADADLSRERIAAASGLSVRRLNEILSGDDTSITSVLLEMRLQHARKFLVRPEYQAMSIGEIAFRSGFHSPEHFARRFKQRYQVSPSELRRANSALNRPI